MKEEQILVQGQEIITVCSDSVGETAETVVRAALKQFVQSGIKIKRIGHIQHEDEIQNIIKEVADHGGLIAYTLVQPELREMMRLESIRLDVKSVDIMGPMMQAIMDTFNDKPSREPGLLHQLDAQYFRRVEAVEFAVKSDDGRDTTALLKADLVIIGVSRTSKTPLSIFLAHKGFKVANLPLVPEVKPPNELFQVPANRIVSLIMDAEPLHRIRTERLKALGLPSGSKYAVMERILEELEYAHAMIKKLGCPMIDVTDKAIEETAGIILDYLQ
jgi:regulator of PEP synthase PpsR (kinase-PPPase family)